MLSLVPYLAVANENASGGGRVTGLQFDPQVTTIETRYQRIAIGIFQYLLGLLPTAWACQGSD